MKTILTKLILSLALVMGLASCADILDPGYGGNYGSRPRSSYENGYGSGYGNSYGNSYHNDGYAYRNENHHDHDRDCYREEPRYIAPTRKSSSHEHCYCSHKSCGCRPGHPKGGCACDGGAHRH